MKTDIDKLIDNSKWTIYIYIGIFIFFITIQSIILLLTNQIKNHWMLFTIMGFSEIMLTIRLIKTELKYKNKLIAIKNRIK